MREFLSLSYLLIHSYQQDTHIAAIQKILLYFYYAILLTIFRNII